MEEKSAGTFCIEYRKRILFLMPQISTEDLSQGSPPKQLQAECAYFSRNSDQIYIFDPTTTATIKMYFPGERDAAGFLHSIHVWWTISIAKGKVNSSYHFGNAAVEIDNKPVFLRSFCQWLKQWDENKIANCEASTLSKQNREALQRTSSCHAALIEDSVAVVLILF